MKLLNGLIIVGIFLFILSCSGDTDIIDNGGMEGPTDRVEYTNKLVGQVVDTDGQALVGIEVFYNSYYVTTDRHGYFNHGAVKVHSDGDRVRTNAKDYIDSYRTIYGTPDGNIFIKIVLVKKETITQFDPVDGVTLNIGNGAAVSIPPNAILTLSGEEYTETVNIFAHWYNPTDPMTIATMPGNLNGTSSKGESVALATYGMIEVEMMTLDNRLLKLNPAIEAILTFPLPDIISAEATETIPLWHFSIQKNTWIESGLAQLVDQTYEAKVNHFSTWNCDIPFTPVQVSGSITDQFDIPISHSKIKVYLDNTFVTPIYTNRLGKFTASLPQNEELEFWIDNNCDDNNVKIPIGPFDQSTDIGVLSPDLSITSQSVQCRLIDCFSNPITDGYALIQSDDPLYGDNMLVPDDEGVIKGIFDNCENQQVTFTAYQANTVLTSETIEINTTDDIIDLGMVSICQQPEEYVSYSINNGSNIILSNPSLVIEDDKTIVIKSSELFNGESYHFNARIDNLILNTPTPAQRVTTSKTVNGESRSVFCITIDDQETCSDIRFTITALGDVGEYVEGTFEGQFQNTSMDAITGNFRAKLDKRYNTGSISGMVWVDDNMNGIRESNEQAQEGFRYGLNAANLPFFLPYSSFRQTDENGQYLFYGLPPDAEYQVLLKSNTNINMSPKDEGTDDTIDSDFHDLGDFTPFSLSTDYIDLAEGEDISNVDMGFKFKELEYTLSPYCNQISLYVTGGNPPYTYTLSPDSYTANSFSGSALASIKLEELTTYTFIVEDSDGNAKTIEYENPVLPITEVSGFIWEETPTMMNHVFNASVDLRLANINVQVVDEQNNVITQTTTDDNGAYAFSLNYLTIGIDKIKIKVNASNEYTLVNKDDGATIEIKSNINPITKLSDLIKVPDCDNNVLTNHIINAGLIKS